MPYRLLRITLPEESADAARSALEDAGAAEVWTMSGTEGGAVVHALTHVSVAQAASDAVSEAMGEGRNWQLVSLAPEAVLPAPESEERQAELEEKDVQTAREEIYDDVREGASFSRDFAVMTALATLVAAIGIQTEQVAVVIGAMVIAPLLGPIMALAFGTALGNRNLLRRSAKSLALGLLIAAAVGTLMGLVIRVDPGNSMMTYGRALGLETIGLPLAAGAAAALMVASANTTSLIGVTVAAALLPPLAAFGLLLGGQYWAQAARAIVIVLTNIIAINLAAQVVFLVKGIRPNRYLSDTYQTSIFTAVGVWAGLAVALAAALFFFGDLGVTASSGPDQQIQSDG
ncbi:TIGR00341 family protein [Mesobaculum littorinae]|uniref:TIGR00341 family protein n=1 Tax=Mesobaculum littorinae TaxID=2486419 RepID=A0A438AI51_9RHOB|nr:TIGR00341 family protein [Mesobaculum littorinae]RVV98362.1 TIGR00341 family protein [Mesobaculum littorinae]